MSDHRGCIRWAFVPFVPAAPFRLYAGPGAPLVTEPDATDWARRIYTQGGSGEHAFVVPGKLRQVLLLEDPKPDPVSEVAALRLVRLDSRPDRERQRIRDQQDEALFHLTPARHPDLKAEMAVSIRSLVRVNANAIVNSAAVTRLDSNEFRVVCERLVRSMGLDLTNLVLEKAATLVKRL